LFSLLKINFKKTSIIGCDHTSASYKSNGLLGRLKWNLYKKIDCLIALTEMDNIFYEKNGVKSVYIPNFISLDRLHDIKVNRKFFLLFVGRLSIEKRPLLALEAYRQSKLAEKGIKFRMFGDGDLYPLIQSYLEGNGLTQSVEVIRGVSNPDLIYKDAYGLILTSSLEGFGMVLVEAISRNIPCVSFDVPCGPRSIIKNGVNGFLVQDGNIEEMSQRIVEIENSKFSDIQHTIGIFDEKVVILKWLALLNSLEYKGV
ncbi:glycosyltransferase, partial [Acinetobacter baumannii]